MLEIGGTAGTGREGAKIVSNGEDVVCNGGAQLGNGEEWTNKQTKEGMNEPMNTHTNTWTNKFIIHSFIHYSLLIY